MKNIRLKKYIKLIIIFLVIIIMDFTYSSFFGRVYATDEESTEVSTSKILESQSETLRNIQLYRRSKQIQK